MTEIADSVLSARYYAENENCWEDVCRRVSNYIGNNDSEKQTFFKLMSECKFIPNSPTLFNAGLPNGQLSACFVLPIEDSIEGIYKTLGEEAKIFATGGGCGANFSNLRPKNSAVKGSKGIASGVVSFMKVFDSSIDAIKQGGRRRGAKMAILNCDHPDILDFLVCKIKEGEISNCNLSVMVTDEFMDYVKKEDFDHVLCQETLNDGTKHDITVGDVWNGLVEGSWRNGEPAILFEGTINKGNKLLKLGYISCTNPCGEQPLLPYESCNLGSINLVKYVGEQGDIDWDSLKEDVRVCTHFLNNVIDKNSFPLKELSKMSQYTRKIGLGIMGLADLFIALRIPYDSQRAVMLAGEILKIIREEAEDESHKMALETEVFPAFKKSTWEHEMRNAALMTIAPTGSISLLANCSSGIEPVFNWVYERRNTVGKSFLMVHPLFEKDLKTMCAGNKQLYEDIINQVFREGTLQNVDCIPQEVKDVYKCALDISPEWHIKMQGECQKYVDASISKTINLPADTTVEDVEKIFLKAYDLGCKGVTVYRTNSRKEVVLSHGEDTIGFKDVIHDGVVYKHCNSCGHEFISNAHCATCPNCGNSFCG